MVVVQWRQKKFQREMSLCIFLPFFADVALSIHHIYIYIYILMEIDMKV
jgi:hypothetical protein